MTCARLTDLRLPDRRAEAFGKEIDFGVLKKIYSNPNKGGGDTATRYSPGECCGIQKRKMIGKPEKKDISTSHVERQNLTMRYVHAPIHAPDQRFQQENRKPWPRRSAALPCSTTSGASTKPCA